MINQTMTKPGVEIYRKITGKKRLILWAMVPVLAGVAFISLGSGAMDITLSELVSILLERFFPARSEVEPLQYITIWELRLPVIMMALLAGTALGMAGTGMQAILNNPLASPYTLGISSAAGFGAALAIIFGNEVVPGGFDFMVAASAFFFSCIAFGFIYMVARIKGGSFGAMLFAGIALMYLFSALLALVQYFAPEEVLQQIVFWMFGSFDSATWTKVLIVAVLVLGAGGFLAKNAWQLTALKFGDDLALGMGIDTQRLRTSTVICTSLLTTAAVCFCGVIGFIGLVAPHWARMLLGEDNRFVIPGSCLIGGILLIAADTIGKMVIAPYVLPVGIVTSFIGAPFFLYLIMRSRYL